MQKWDYLYLSHTSDGMVYDLNGKNILPEIHWAVYANQLGEHGWELVTSSGNDGSTLIFKRPSD